MKKLDCKTLAKQDHHITNCRTQDAQFILREKNTPTTISVLFS